MGIIMSVLFPNSEVGHLLGGRGKLSHLLTGGIELCSQPLTPPRLLSKELKLLLAMGHKDLRRRQDLEAWKENMRVRSMVISYLASQGDNVVHRAQHGGQGVNRVPNLRVDAPLFPLLYCFIKGSHPDQRPRYPRANLKRRRPLWRWRLL